MLNTFVDFTKLCIKGNGFILVNCRRRSKFKSDKYLSKQDNVTGSHENTNCNHSLKTDDVYQNVGNVRDSENEKSSVFGKKKSKTSVIEVKDEYSKEEEEEEEEGGGREEEEKAEGANVYNNVASEQNITKYKIQIADLKHFINDKRKGDGFKNEYEILPTGLFYPHTEGSKDENKVKNRFFSTRPYDHSRVVLTGDTKHDYINASYIDKKCEQYWPKTINKATMVDNYILTMIQEIYHTIYAYRLIILHNTKNLQERKVYHFHFTQWPDHGVPDSIKVVIFYRKVKSKKCDKNGPMVVHCSAGVGRTGTFIAIDALCEQGKSVGYVDVMEYVQMMRKDRMNMIQTYRLRTFRPSYSSNSFTAANCKRNKSKNSTTVLAHDKYRPYLMSYGKNRSDYINAVIIPGYADDSKIFVTQCPLVETVIDFWTTMYDHSSKTIVLLDAKNKGAPLWLEKKEMLQFGDLSIVKKREMHMKNLRFL